MVRKLTLLFFVIIVAIFTWQAFFSPKDSSLKQEQIFTIGKGDGARQISRDLEKEGFIKNDSLFFFYTVLTGKSGRLQAGDYYLSPAMPVSDIAGKLSRGDTAKEKIIIIEGWNLRDTAFYLENKGLFQAEQLWEIAGFPAVWSAKDLPRPKDYSAAFEFLKERPEEINLEGYLFPDTYYMDYGFSVDDLIVASLSNFDVKMTDDIIEEIKGQGKTIFEIVTVASLLEKEVRTIEDKKIVSGILWKRLEAGIPLQIDATITYVTGKKTTRISKEETMIDSPYNTYKYGGLPVGPISNPGLESILAAVYPEKSLYLYYLSAPEGQTLFSKTLEEHNIAKAKYLK